ncbi:SAF domain-containing protein [Nocardioides sp. GXZ039]|uniref:SAF domain-containing protein n=1 Tax=Nocardioides sp. GXZ039 TaxID=3136018 RepID=UPI0030F49583
MSSQTPTTSSTPAKQRKQKATKKPSRSLTERSGPPRQRRPALAALAVILIVGGALLAGLLAVRLDSREPVLAAARPIEAGAVITEDDVKEVKVASEGLVLIPAEFADDILNGKTYAKFPIGPDTLLDENMLTTTNPVDGDRAVVSIPLSSKLTPAATLRSGDLIEIIRVGGSGSDAEPKVLSQGLVLSVDKGSSDDLGGSSEGTLQVLVPSEVAAQVIGAAGGDQAGVALLKHNQPFDIELEVPAQ